MGNNKKGGALLLPLLSKLYFKLPLYEHRHDDVCIIIRPHRL